MFSENIYTWRFSDIFIKNIPSPITALQIFLIMELYVSFTCMVLLCRNDELNTQLKFDVERLSRQIERRTSQPAIGGTESVSLPVQIAFVVFLM